MTVIAQVPQNESIEAVRTLPGRYYSDPALFELEAERIFSRLWVCAGRADALPEPGNYLLRQLGRESVLVLRDRQGMLRAFLNVCRHRGARLCTASSGTLNATIQCAYHAWTYSLDGSLVGAPNMRADASFDAERLGLLPVHLRVWEGLIWLNLSEHPNPLNGQLGTLHDQFARYHVGDLVSAATVTYDVHANWKLIVENFNECYHCSVVHPELAAQVPDYRKGKVTGEDGGAAMLGPGIESLTTTGKTNRPPLPGLSGDDLHAYYGDTLKPNVFLNLHPDYAVVHVLQPLAPDHTRVVCDWLFDRETAAAPGFDPADAVDFWDIVNRQDWHVCELAQPNMASRAYEHGGMYGPDERHIRRFNDWVLSMLQHAGGDRA